LQSIGHVQPNERAGLLRWERIFRAGQYARHTSNFQADMFLRKTGILLGYGLLLACLFVQTSSQLAAQARNSNWIFAPGIWLHFEPDTILAFPMADTVSLRNASISDTTGQFALLADDFGIRNALFETVAGGSAAELGWNVPAASYLILPLPGQADQYGVFINERPPGSRAGFVQVDLGANNGAGTVLGGTTWYLEHATAKLTATTDSTETGYWILQHDESGDAFRAFHLTAAGLDPAPVISHVGTSYLPDTSPKENIDRYGQMNFNFQGDLVAAIKNGPSIDTSKVELFRFNRATGELQMEAEVGALYYDGNAGPAGLLQALLQGVDFSLGGSYMVVGHIDTLSTMNNSWIVRYPLGAPWDSLITSSSSLINGVSGDTLRYDTRYGIQFATTPYGKILIRRPYRPADLILNFQHMFEIAIPDPGPFSGWTYYAFAGMPVPGGFPSPCKRYVDSTPLITGIGQLTTFHTEVGIRPNPMADQATLFYRGNDSPQSVVWRDALGREVRRTTWRMAGSTHTLERNGLPAGVYYVEVLGERGVLGAVKLFCE